MRKIADEYRADHSIQLSGNQHKRLKKLSSTLPKPNFKRKGGKYGMNDALELALQLLERQLGIDNDLDPVKMTEYRIPELDRVLRDMGKE